MAAKKRRGRETEVFNLQNDRSGRAVSTSAESEGVHREFDLEAVREHREGFDEAARTLVAGQKSLRA